jgi:hypothetical protein
MRLERVGAQSCTFSVIRYAVSSRKDAAVVSAAFAALTAQREEREAAEGERCDDVISFCSLTFTTKGEASLILQAEDLQCLREELNRCGRSAERKKERLISATDSFSAFSFCRSCEERYGMESD